MVASQSPGRVALVRLNLSDIGVLAGQDVRGHEVRDIDNATVGRVDDLVVEVNSGRVRFLVIGEGGILGIGRSHHLVPVDVVESVANEWVFLSTTAARISGIPDTGSIEDQRYLAEILEYLGCKPFWSAGYTDPDWTTPA